MRLCGVRNRVRRGAVVLLGALVITVSGWLPAPGGDDDGYRSGPGAPRPADAK